jgi:hypothetical protein
VTVVREPEGHYYASFVVDVPTSPLPKLAREAGVDVGLSRLATIANSDSERSDVPNLKNLQRKLRKLRRLEREKARRQKGSRNRDKTRRKIAITHGAVARTRRDYHHKQALALIRENQVVYVEDLNIVGMLGNRRLARAISDAGWGQFLRILNEKGRTIRPHRAYGVALVGVQQDLFDVPASAGRIGFTNSHLDMSIMRHGPRPRLQRCQGHSRRRAGGETKRLPHSWAESHQRFRWSSCKPSRRSGGGGQ